MSEGQTPAGFVSGLLSRQFWFGRRRVWTLMLVAGWVMLGLTWVLFEQGDDVPSWLGTTALMASVVSAMVGVLGLKLEDSLEERRAARVREAGRARSAPGQPGHGGDHED